MCRWATHIQVLGPGSRVQGLARSAEEARTEVRLTRSVGAHLHDESQSDRRPKTLPIPRTPDITDTPDTVHLTHTGHNNPGHLGRITPWNDTQDTLDRHWNPFTDSFSLLTSRRAGGAATSFAWRYELAGAPCLPCDSSDTQKTCVSAQKQDRARTDHHQHKS